jgi:glycosyltransferase involved in cell wall biosynthesis
LPKTDVCSLGSFPSKIPYKEASLKSPLKVLVSGRIEEWIGLKTLGVLIKDLKYEGIKVKLIVIDKSAPNSLKENSIEVINTYIDYSDFIRLLTEAHVLLLLRPRSLHHLLTVRATLVDYMMAGRPILYLRSLGSKEIVDDLKGCYSFVSLKEVSSFLKQLYANMSVINELGKKIREYAEKHFNYEVLALNLLKKIVCQLRSMYIRR